VSAYQVSIHAPLHSSGRPGHSLKGNFVYTQIQNSIIHIVFMFEIIFKKKLTFIAGMVK